MVTHAQTQIHIGKTITRHLEHTFIFIIHTRTSLGKPPMVSVGLARIPSCLFPNEMNEMEPYLINF